MNRRTFVATTALGASAVIGHVHAAAAIDTDAAAESRSDGVGVARCTCAFVPYATDSSVPTWWDPEEATAGALERFDSRADARDRLDLEAIGDDRRVDVETFLEATDFDDSSVLYVASAGPSRCHDSLEVTPLEDGSKRQLRATVLDSSGENERCRPTITFPSVLLRVPTAVVKADDASITIVDGWENETKLSIRSASRDSAS